MTSNALTPKQQKQVEAAAINAIRAELEMHHSYAVSNKTHKAAFVKLLTTVVDPKDNDSAQAVKHLMQLSKHSSKTTQAAMKSVSKDADAVHKMCVIFWEDRTKQGRGLFKGGRSKGFGNWFTRQFVQTAALGATINAALIPAAVVAINSFVNQHGHPPVTAEEYETFQEGLIRTPMGKTSLAAGFISGIVAAYQTNKAGKNWASSEKALSKLIRTTRRQRNSAASSTKKRRR